MSKNEIATLPYNEAAEKAVLGCLLLENNLITEALETLTTEYFYSGKNRAIFEAMINLAKDKKPIELVILVDILKDKIEPTYLTEIASFTPTSANLAHYIEILKAYYIRRRIIQESHRYIGKANSGEDYSDVLGDMAQTFSKLAQEQIKSDIITPNELAKTGAADFTNRLDNGICFSGLSSGYTHLDRLCSGFGKGDLIIVAGATNIGKSALLLDIAYRLCLKESYAGAYFSLEMGRHEIFYRLISKISSQDLTKIKTPKLLKDEEIQEVLKAVSRLNSSRFFLDVTPVLNVNKLIAKAKRIKAKENIGFICVDYLQLISYKSRDQARHEVLSEITKDLKQLARELDIPVIAGAQLNRSTLEEAEPSLRHIGESFAIVQHSDTVILISKTGTSAVLDVAKARQAAGGRFELDFDHKTVSFVERKESR